MTNAGLNPEEPSPDRESVRADYQAAATLVVEGNRLEARLRYEELLGDTQARGMRALIQNDLATLDALDGDLETGRAGYLAALETDPTCEPARRNLESLEAHNTLPASAEPEPSRPPVRVTPPQRIRVAVLSFLFNWPSTGGGNVHTVELVKFLSAAGYNVRHLYVQYDPWGIGQVDGSLPINSEALPFNELLWCTPVIQARFRQAVDEYDPDYVIITDAWNFKPLLAEAVRAYPYFLRQQALECLCPLNNLRLLNAGPDGFDQCPLNQLDNPEDCHSCLQSRDGQSGQLHRLERELSGVGTPEYQYCLRRALADAEAVFVLNPSIQKLIGPHAPSARVVTWGMDPARFPWPWPEPEDESDRRKRVFMAGVAEEPIKGFQVLREACERLWRKRQDFELVATGKPPGVVNDFTRFTGWLSQEELPRQLRAADMLVMPTVAQEGLGRTTVEAMAVGRPVIASNIGGLPHTVTDGETGLLCEPGNANDLANKIERLLDDSAMRERMGLAGRRRFERDFSWPQVIDRQYRPLLCRARRRPLG